MWSSSAVVRSGAQWSERGRGGAGRPLALHKGREAHRLRRSVWLRLRHLLLLLYLQPVAAAHSDDAVPPTLANDRSHDVLT